MSVKDSTVSALIASILLVAGFIAGKIHSDTGANSSRLNGIAYTTKEVRCDADWSGGRPSTRSQLNPSLVRTDLRSVDTVSRRNVGFERYPRPIPTQPAGTGQDSLETVHLGDYLNPDEPHEEPGITPQHIGQFLDPDEHWIQEPLPNPVALGGTISPEEFEFEL